ncbi:MAG: hypothetical protein E7287_08710 [Lachnospiraceae bacterium]|nr:hypothetical protein [Lachnospiraceae bacterium]
MESNAGIRAYLTVEAAMVVPVVIGTIVFLIYMMFYQYNRCLLEQDVGVLAVRSVAMQEKDKTTLAVKLNEEAATLDNEKYVAWIMGEPDISIKGTITGISRMGGLVLTSGDLWKTQAVFESEQISPTFLVRSCRKIMGGK